MRKCLVEEMSAWGNVHLRKCPFEEMSGTQIYQQNCFAKTHFNSVHRRRTRSCVNLPVYDCILIMQTPLRLSFPKPGGDFDHHAFYLRLINFHASFFWDGFDKALENFFCSKKYEKRGGAPEVIIAAGAIAENTYFSSPIWTSSIIVKNSFRFEKRDILISNSNLNQQNLLPVVNECERDSCTRVAEAISGETGNGLLRKRYT